MRQTKTHDTKHNKQMRQTIANEPKQQTTGTNQSKGATKDKHMRQQKSKEKNNTKETNITMSRGDT